MWALTSWIVLIASLGLAVFGLWPHPVDAAERARNRGTGLLGLGFALNSNRLEHVGLPAPVVVGLGVIGMVILLVGIRTMLQTAPQPRQG